MLALVLASAGYLVAVPQVADAAPGSVSTVYYWNDTLLEAFRRQGGGPGPLSRAAALMHGAIFDVLNAAHWVREASNRTEYEPAFEFIDAYWIFSRYGEVDDDLAASMVARAMLQSALPQQSTYISERYTARHGDTTQTSANYLANRVIGAIQLQRGIDVPSQPAPYQPDNVPGAWRPTGCAGPVDPHWGQVKPFVMTSPTQARRPLPGGYPTYQALLASQFYAAQVNEVRSLGRADSTTRTADQTQAAFYWANDANGTYKPPGQLLAHTRVVAEPRITRSLTLSRLFAQVSLAMADGAIASWDQKYLTPVDLWRPVSAIQMADLDNNPATAQDTTWRPLGATPCFPAYTAGHAVFAGAWAGVMRATFGDNVTFTAGTEDPNARSVNRTFTSFTQAATENARSRVYLGVHFQTDNDEGLATGTTIANLTLQKMR